MCLLPTYLYLGTLKFYTLGWGETPGKSFMRYLACNIFSYTKYDIPSFQVENECGEIPTIIVQNKIDLMDQCVVGP